MSLGDYLISIVLLALVVVPLALAAVWLRGRLLPGWTGAPARLVEAVLGASLLTVILQLLGAIGAFNLIGLLALGLLAPILVRRAIPGPGGDREGGPPPAPPIPRLHLILALAAAVFLATHWATGLQDVWGRGITTFDSLWYHGPFSARIAEEFTVWPLHFSDPLYLNWFYPQNSELQHAAGMTLFSNDLLSPFLNFAWLGLALLAAWCIGRPYGVAPLSLVAVVVLLDTGPMVPREAGTMANDIAPIALLLAAAAILINATARPPTRAAPAVPDTSILLMSGLAAGLALGTKMTIAGGVAALAIGVAFVAPRELRLRAFGLFVGGVAITAGFWFVRNLVHSGNPLPWIAEIGPIELPGPDRGLEGRDPYNVAHYIFENPSGEVWNSYFLEGVTNLLGPGWFLVVGGAVLGAALALIRPRSRTVRMLGAVAIAAAIAYVFTPLTAAGPDGNPTAFTINFRYSFAAIALGLALLPLWGPLAAERLRTPVGGEISGELFRTLLLAGGLIVLLATSQYSDSARTWDDPFTHIPAAILIGLVMIGAPVGLALLGRRSAALAAGAGATLALIVAGVGYERQDDYLDARYDGSDVFQFQLDDAVRFVNRGEGDEELRVAVAGTSGGYNQYGFYGEDLDNHVQYIGDQRSGGDFREIEKCAPWRVMVNRGSYDLLITSPDLDLNDPAEPKPAPERGWVIGNPNATEVLRTGRVSVFRLDGPLDPATCREDAARAARSRRAAR